MSPTKTLKKTFKGLGFSCKALYDLLFICLSTVLPHLPYPILRTVAVATLSKALFPEYVLMVSDPLPSAQNLFIPSSPHSPLFTAQLSHFFWKIFLNPPNRIGHSLL